MANQDDFKKAVALGRHRIATLGYGGVIVVVDADDDCPATASPALVATVQAICDDQVASVVLANREYESWFLAAAASLAAHSRIRDDAVAPPNPEHIRDAKGHFERHIMLDDEYYSASVDQPAFTSQMDINQASTAASFSKLLRDIARFANAFPHEE